MIGLLPSTYRSGSRWLYLSFRDAYKDILKMYHEAPFDVFHTKPGLNTGWPIARDLEAYQIAFPEIPIIQVVRNPIDVARSAHRNGLDDAEVALDLWFGTHYKLAKRAFPLVKIEDVWSKPAILHDMAGHIGLPYRDELTDWANTPSGGATAAVTVPGFKIPPDTQDLAQEFGYDLPDEVGPKTYEHIFAGKPRKQIAHVVGV